MGRRLRQNDTNISEICIGCPIYIGHPIYIRHPISATSDIQYLTSARARARARVRVRARAGISMSEIYIGSRI